MGRPPLADYHGTPSGYRVHRCNCEPCKAVHRQSVKEYRVRSRLDRKTGQPQIHTTVPAGPVTTHIENLMRSGLTIPEIATESGVSPAALHRIRKGHRARVWARTAAALATVQPLPTDVVDEVVVERLVAGATWRDIRATRAERLAAAPIIAVRESAQAALDRLGLQPGRDFPTQKQLQAVS